LEYEFGLYHFKWHNARQKEQSFLNNLTAEIISAQISSSEFSIVNKLFAKVVIQRGKKDQYDIQYHMRDDYVDFLK